MNNFNIKQYLAEGRLLKEGESKKVTKDMWKIMSKEQKTDALLSVFKDPDDALLHIEKKWVNLPDEKDYMVIWEGFWTPQRATYPSRNRKPELKKDNKDKKPMSDEELEDLETRADDHFSEPLKEREMPMVHMGGGPDAEAMRAQIVQFYKSTDDTALVDFYEELGIGSGNVTKDFSLMKNQLGDLDYDEQGEEFIEAKLDELYNKLYDHIINLDDVEAMELWMQIFTPDDYEDYKITKDNEKMWKDVDYNLGLGKERHGIDEEDATSWKRNNSPAGETLKLAPKKVGQSIKEGVWEIGSKQGIMEFINKLKQLKNVYYNTVGSDDVMDGLDAAIKGAEELYKRAKDNPHEKSYFDSLKEISNREKESLINKEFWKVIKDMGGDYNDEGDGRVTISFEGDGIDVQFEYHRSRHDLNAYNEDLEDARVEDLFIKLENKLNAILDNANELGEAFNPTSGAYSKPPNPVTKDVKQSYTKAVNLRSMMQEKIFNELRGKSKNNG